MSLCVYEHFRKYSIIVPKCILHDSLLLAVTILPVSYCTQIALAHSDVTVPKRLFERLNESRVSLFTQELAILIFGEDTLANSTLTGKSGMQTAKEQLDPHKVNVLIGMCGSPT